ncbi:ankyrin repeat-containing domain protein [Glomus cerebriforme]|uniref:Ankyrin repeat-containing domain protein n=1 Tax=Glomus cerebriforme TaxID=658196 RepID=A0A397T8A5_9GLOM|nr:ankyrin repeat-containing domain protein [Glomus cerebriforme]
MSDNNIWVAAGNGDIQRVTELIRSGISPNSRDSNGYTPLAAATSYNHIDLIDFLISEGADVNIRDNDNDTPLYVAENVKVAQKLLSHGADPFIINSEGKTPAQVAYEEEWFDVAELYRSITGEQIPKSDD